MALILCPECQNQMSDTAPACPKCGWARALAFGAQAASYPQHAYPQAPAPKKGMPGWALAILIVVGAFVVLGGILAVLAIHGVREFIAAAKTAEARNSLGMMARDAATAFEGEDLAGTEPRRLCASASQPVPASISSVRGHKYQSSSVDWSVDETANAGFACLEFSMTEPQYYQYSYTATTRGGPGDSFAARAMGDLDGDGVTSSFELRGAVTADGLLQIAPSIAEDKPEE